MSAQATEHCAKLIDLEEVRWQRLATLDAERELEVVAQIMALYRKGDLSALMAREIIRGER